MSFYRRILTTLLFLLSALPAAASNYTGPANFADAKLLLRTHVYFDQHRNGALGTLYCGCNWRWTGASGGRIDLNSCGYQIRALPQRAQRIEWEHVVPASWLGRQRQCWQQGGRNYCQEHDPLFNLMEADMHNLSPVIGEVNADRSHFRFGHTPQVPALYGSCSSRTDFKNRTFEPRKQARGMVARINFYMHDRYNLAMSQQQQRLFMQWHQAYPASPWELERDRRIKAITGHSNPFVTGARQWREHHKNSADGLRVLPAAKPSGPSPRVKGNRSSRIYHLPHCPNYPDVSARNSVPFKNEQQARQAGFRKARNC